MHAPLTLIDGTDVTRRGAEDQMIAEALSLLDRRYFTRGECLFSPTAVADYLKLQLAGHHQEVFAMVCLDARHRPLSFEKVFFGSIDSASVYPREIVIRALACNAAAVIFSHFVARHKMHIMCPVFLCVRRRRHRRRSRISAQSQET
jgi:DNA repair protein RadC